MKFTVDTSTQIITFHGSFHYSEFAAFRETLPKEWQEGYLFLVPFDSIESVLQVAADKKQIEQPSYPVAAYDPRESNYSCCGGEGAVCGCRNEDC